MRKTKNILLDKRGFSLIEAILTLVILAAGTMGVMSIFTSSVNEFNNSEQMASSSFLAQEKLEKMIGDKKSQGYSYITSANYPSSESLTSPFNGYTRTTSILEVSSSNLSSSSPGSGYKKITVGITTPMGATYSFATLVTNWESP